MWAFDCNKSRWPWTSIYSYDVRDMRILTKQLRLRIMQFSLKCSPRLYLFACQVWLRNSKGGPLIGRLNLGWGGFWLRDAISRKRCEIGLQARWQLITNRKSYIGFRLQQKLMTLNDLKRQFTAMSSVFCVLYCDKSTEVRITRFSRKSRVTS